jgi:hypothetical protein
MSVARPHHRSLADILYIVGIATVFFLAAHGLFRKVTWYLAIDQYGYLTFAGDLAQGRIFHEWPPMQVLAPAIPVPHVDVRAQTYVFDGERMFCRYTPGFPILLAAWMRMLGANAAHYIDPTLFLALLAVHHALARRLLAAVAGARWLALVGTLLLLLLPSYLHLWAITILRDIAAQLFALTAMLVTVRRDVPMSRRRAGLIGFLVGYLICIRIDAGLFALPIGLLFLTQARARGSMAVAAALFVIGVTPLLLYNHASTGNPLRPTQSMELESFFQARHESPDNAPATARAEPPPRHAANRQLRRITPDDGTIGAPSPAPLTVAQNRAVQSAAAAPPPVQGGGLRLSNLPRTFPGNVQYLRNAFGTVVLTLALLGVVTALVTNRRLFMATVPYVAVALVFYSCWSRPDPRYIAGIFVLTPFLTLAGLSGLWQGSAALRRARDAGRLSLIWQLAIVAGATSCAVWLWSDDLQVAWFTVEEAVAAGAWRGGSALPVVSALVALLAIVPTCSLTLAGSRPGRRVATWPAATLAILLVLTAVVRAIPGWHRHASFQSAEVAAARETIESVVPPGAVVVTTDEVGRPAENIDHYTHAHALYLEDLARWRIPLRRTMILLLDAGHEVYFLIPSASRSGRAAIDRLRTRLLQVTHVAHVDAGEAHRYFVASRFGAQPLDFYRIQPLGGR